ncbi:hypothetical protein J5N97_007041 [Dioscorea zingiberensis]|uniref:PORR domain-containing protein n=1 Tax=Dioscorea zingiberensis TaxID=325984 RepID=A0A9D5DBJ6_9LILI|nr:hypothetical protein J5N97_007041 [Dioscorea zingiberensis]
MVWWTGRSLRPRRPHSSRLAVELQRASLVNVKLKWVKDRMLDSVVSRERHLRPALHLIERISADPRGQAPAQELSGRRHQSEIATFMRRFPTIFHETSSPSTGGPWFALTDAACLLRHRELQILREMESDLVDRLRRLLMMTVARALPLDTIDQLRWDMGLPPCYPESLVPRYPTFFELVQPPGDERVWLKLVSWDPGLVVSELQRSSAAQGRGELVEECLAFPVRFARGFGLKRKCMEWLREWQTLPYTSPYADASGLDPRTDVSEKRNVGVFHELLHLTLGKKTERKNVSNLRKALALPQKFTKVFERHPGIFYLSEKLATQTVVLREAYGTGRELICKHPLIDIREEYAAIMRDASPLDVRCRRTSLISK